MTPVMSTSTVRKLPVVNDRCALRRNVAVQPYGRCSVCSLELQQCHAWQSSAMSFALVILILVPLFAPGSWAIQLAVAGSLLLLVVQGMVNHKRTDELIFGQHEVASSSRKLRETNVALEHARQNLEREVAARTESLRETNVALAQANLELAELARGREQAMLDLSHDLRTPLTSVKGAADNLLDGIAGPLGESQREYVQIVRDHAERLIGAVNELLRAAARQDVRVVLDLGPVEVLGLARDVARSLQPIAADKGITVEVRGTAVETLADREKLRKAFENLIGNALKFTGRGGVVQLDVAQDDTNVRVTVEDTGTGMASSELERVFDRFYRGRGEGAGAGLGLSITRDLVRLHGGDVIARSVRGEGSAFSAVLPKRTAA
jgi:signal transduction histidine kinase